MTEISIFMKNLCSTYDEFLQSLDKANAMADQEALEGEGLDSFCGLVENLTESKRDLEGLLLSEQEQVFRQVCLKYEEVKPKPKAPAIVTSSKKNFIEIPEIVCHDADGNIIEEYRDLYVMKDVFRDGAGNIIFLNPYKATRHCENEQLYNPSMALWCNILAWAYKNKGCNPDARELFFKFKDKGNGNGWHVANTIVPWKKGRGSVIHYPCDNDFPNYGGNGEINQDRLRKELDFRVNGSFGDVPISEALSDDGFRRYIINLTGLVDPNILVGMGKEFGKTAKIWVPNSPNKADYTSGAWLGCGYNYFNFFSYNVLNISNAVRGVASHR